MELICKVVGIRQLGVNEYGEGGLMNEKAIDLLWRADDGSALRDDGAIEIPDQINLPLDADDQSIEEAIFEKRAALMQALAQPGFGIVIEAEELPTSNLVGREF